MEGPPPTLEEYSPTWAIFAPYLLRQRHSTTASSPVRPRRLLAEQSAEGNRDRVEGPKRAKAKRFPVYAALGPSQPPEVESCTSLKEVHNVIAPPGIILWGLFCLLCSERPDAQLALVIETGNCGDICRPSPGVCQEGRRQKLVALGETDPPRPGGSRPKINR